MRAERLSLLIVLALSVLLPGALMLYQAARNWTPGVRLVEMTANAPERGGWTPADLRFTVGERIRLRLASPDVVHGFEVPELGLVVDEILPGQVREVEFFADRPGRFAFQCTRWCGLDHWRMRGVIEIVSADGSLPRPLMEPPLYQRLGLDLDAMVTVSDLPARAPSAARGAQLGVSLSSEWNDISWLRTQAPAGAWLRLRTASAYASLSDADLWDLTAFGWQRTADPEGLARGERLYARDCAACHGEMGRGDGPAGRNLPGLSPMHPGMRAGPTDFTDRQRMLAVSDALLQGKVLRGGMGTGMPEWGSLYSEADLWALVGFLRTFVWGR